ncbi:hypothetical protein HY68_36965 [Streptomyces sp. AcH 505]|uniref:hypothetical protein n=1 Tax=Streptomyces sp. AcH 505 TaxID=352211 RepID=UPI0005920B1C|nr:hypothetical protein HY68_36965 [Streptomyces sp. AcH 505]
MAAQLKGTVYVTDPDTHQTVELAPGTLPEPHLAALVTNPSAWEDGELPVFPGGDTPPVEPEAPTDPGNPADPGEDTKPAVKKQAAKKTAARKTTAN